VPRFSSLALLSVAVLLLAGTVNGYLQVRALRGLWETDYGLLLMAKVGLVLPLLVLGAYNNRRAVPRLRRQLASALERRRFVRAAGAELALMTAVVGVTAVLVAEPPARAEVAPKGPYSTLASLGPLELNLVVDPAQAGANDIHLYLSDETGRPANAAETRVSAVLASKRIGPLRFRATRIAPGHFSVYGAQLALAGDWQLGVEARRGEFESLTASVSVPIRKES
jgi:copper transport protein